ncbi:phosphotransferase [Citrobacter sp. CK198]|uniref:phosphotransferase n=1 Tax=Citrobacter sp. CK198 TaxID=2985107 RepID=UPI002578798D|nr:phosphotransferase [Citrobacter sp. CK198]MDM2974103.1 phosphotransferase [Citrobacter sp. CK198]
MLTRLETALMRWEPSRHFDIQPGTAGVASPHRLATEWAGFHLKADGQHYYAKVLFDDQNALIDIPRSAGISFQAGELGIAPALCHADMEAGVLIFAALDDDYRWARLDELRDPRNFISLTRTLDKLHQARSPLPPHRRQQDMLNLRQQVTGRGLKLPDEMYWLGECADLAWQALNAVPFDPVLLHGDNVASNWMINSKGEWRLLDFDYAAQGDAWHDIATLLHEQLPTDDRWRDAIRTWRGHCSEADVARCRLYALVDDYHWSLWGIFNGMTSLRNLEFSKLGQWMQLRCRQSASDPRFERWLTLTAEKAK